MKDWTIWVDAESSSELVNIFGIVLALTVFFGPTAGIIIDSVAKHLSKVSPSKIVVVHNTSLEIQ